MIKRYVVVDMTSIGSRNSRYMIAGATIPGENKKASAISLIATPAVNLFEEDNEFLLRVESALLMMTPE